MKLIKEYDTYILFEHEKGFKVCINKQELGMVPDVLEKPNGKSGFHRNLFKEDKDIEKRKPYRKYKPVYQYDLQGNLIKKWDSQSLAAKELFMSATSIHNCCINRTKTSGGYVWKYEEE